MTKKEQLLTLISYYELFREHISNSSWRACGYCDDDDEEMERSPGAGWLTALQACENVQMTSAELRLYTGWLSKIFDYVKAYLMRAGLVASQSGGTDPLTAMISVLCSYGWRYETGYLYDRDEEFDSNEVFLPEWRNVIYPKIRSKHAMFIEKAVEAYYESMFAIPDEECLYTEYLDVRYICLTKRVGEVSPELEQELLSLGERFVLLHEDAQIAISAYEHGSLKICVVIPEYVASSYGYYETVWEDDGLETMIALLMEVVELSLQEGRANAALVSENL